MVNLCISMDGWGMEIMDLNFEIYWWWFIAGVMLVVAEFAVPGVFICFFGVGALLTGTAVWLFPSLPPAAQIALFAVLGVGVLAGCRRFMPQSFRGSKKIDDSDIENDDIAGAEAVVTEEIAPGAPGKVEFRGSQWTARADRVIAVGERASIVRRKNLTLFLK